ncbi:hypothetical protein A2U01_0006066 [Trifolium medium]|uniref:HD domain-containing protein n=1 Tax=Trifolium medium TaxID=97028 RepID=A0A392MCJ0_9FABA|nr:hypothetical protein [Trifolium medium]
MGLMALIAPDFPGVDRDNEVSSTLDRKVKVEYMVLNCGYGCLNRCSRCDCVALKPNVDDPPGSPHDPTRCVKMAIVHDIAEAVTCDCQFLQPKGTEFKSPMERMYDLVLTPE